MTVARELRDQAEVTLFEKSRGPGGRMATRYADPYRFDHGTQFFIARTSAFRKLAGWLVDEGVVAHWPARFAELQGNEITAQRQWQSSHPHYVGVPGMNAIGQRLARDLDVQLDCTVDEIVRTGSRWQLRIGHTMMGDYDWVVCTAPVEQALALLPDDFAHRNLLDPGVMLGCYALMLGFDQSPGLPFDAALVRDADISWISANSTKPGRAEVFTVVVHATNAWADAHMGEPRADVLAHMLAEVSRVSGCDLSHADHQAVHRWRYANLPKQDGPASHVDARLGLAACGDWCIRGRVEAAFRSGLDAAAQIATFL
ncbi:MAG: FAD-dependent oxidoreductase [Gammaproteobacteria bacterium]|nr:FAD-dependent oxidoreductase [Gammaproteobacteria bacterium]